MANNMSTDGVRAAFGSASINGSYNAEIAGVRFELYWDDQDPSNEGWWLRCVYANGHEDGYPVDGDTDRPDWADVARAVSGATRG